ncbi:MAG: ATP-binding protein [Bacteroidota bacterium]|nr:ATP-binding protein [Bacteroidota bacterium]
MYSVCIDTSMEKFAELRRESVQALRIISIKKIACLLLLIGGYNVSFCQSEIQAKKGVLDLRNWNWKTDGITDLNGEWEFYWKSLYKPSSFDSVDIKPSIYSNVPDFWNSLVPGLGVFDPAFGYATYRLKILCPASNEKLNLKFLTVASAYKLFVNGKQLLEVGVVGTSKDSVVPAYNPVIVPVIPENNELNIIIQVSNFNYNTGGLWDFIKLGTQEQVHSFWIRNVSLDFFICGSFFFMGIFYFVVYFFFRRRKVSLYFSIFCILLAVRPLVTGELPINYITNWSWHFIKRVEFISFYLTVPVLSLISFELFPKEFSKKVLRYILIISAPFLLAAMFTSPFIFRYGLRPFQVFMLLTACYGLFVYTKAVKKKRPGSGYFLVGFIIFFLTLVNDLLYASLIIESLHLIYEGIFIFVILQAVALSRQFFWTFTRLEEVNEKLENLNIELSQKNNIINESNDQLTQLNAELDILVFRATHDLRSPVTSIVALVHIIKEEKNEAKRNQYLELQRKALERLTTIISDILDFSKNKRSELNYEPVNFNEFVHSAMEDHIFSDNSSDIKRIVEVDQQGTFVTDKARLNMIITNLISNALRYHNKEQANPYLKITVNATNKHAEIQVIDNGQGIEEKHLPHIFTMFYRANKTSASSGLGLYIVKEAVEKLGGTIKLESVIDAGTRFIVVIPNHGSDL